MARNKGKKKTKSKSRKKAAQKAKISNQSQTSHIVASNQNTARDGERNRHAAMTSDENPEATLRGCAASLRADNGMLAFNPSAINAHDEGDQDVTLVDLSPAKAEEERSPLFDDVPTVKSRGMDIFKVTPAREHLTVAGTQSEAKDQRSLEHIITDNPDTRFSNLDGQTLAFAGHAVGQVVLEATYDFVQRCIPEAEQQGLWDQLCGRGDEGTTTSYSLSLRDGILDPKNGVRSTSDLIGNCIDVLSQNAAVIDQKTLRLSLSRAVTLCDAVGDEKRKTALEKAADKLEWLMLGLDCKTMGLYRMVNQQLDRINLEYPAGIEVGGASGGGVCDERRLEERSVLQSMKLAHEGFKEPYRIRFIEALQSLLAL